MDSIEDEPAYCQIYGVRTTPLIDEDADLDTRIIHSSSISVANSNNRRVSDELRNKISRTFGIGLETASRTLKATTQLALRHAIHPIHKRYSTKVAQLRYPRLTGRHGIFHTDTFFADTPTLSACTMGQMYTNDVDFSKFYPMRRKGEVADTLIAFMQDIGIPSGLHNDNAKELAQGRVAEIAKEFWVKVSQSEPYSPWQVRAELCIREIKKAVRHSMQRTRAPKRLWDYCTVYQCELRNLIAHPHYSLNNRTPYEMVTGRTPDISEYLDYGWYDTLWYYDQEANFPNERRKLGKWLGVAHRVGQALCYYILNENAQVIVRSTVQPISKEEFNTQIIQQQISELDQRIVERIGTVDLADIPQELQDDYDLSEPMEPAACKPDIDVVGEEQYDTLISAEVMLPQNGILCPAKVTGRKQDEHGNPVGVAHNNPVLDTRVYEVTFPDGSVNEYAANLIIENIFQQVDEEGRQHLLFQEIMDHRKDHTALPFTPENIHKAKTTKGWFLQVLWKDGTSTWEPLRDMKEANPIEVAEYAVANQIGHHPAFAWWVPHVLKKRDRFIAMAKARKVKKDFKFGIEVPTSVERALAIDRETNTDFWAKAIEKEMTHVFPAFKILEEGEKAPIMSKYIRCHMIFDLKLDLTRKARFVAGGHMTDPPTCLTYSSVVSRDSVRLAFLIAALNDLDILSADIGNAYLNAETKERVHTICGPEFGSHYLGRVAVIQKALYGLKSSGAAWRSKFAGTLSDLQFSSSLADPDVWLRPAIKENGETYYEYIFVYVDDILVLSTTPEKIIKTIGQSYRLKENSVSRPKTYLGAEIKPFRDPHQPAVEMWSMSADGYLKEALKSLEHDLEKGQMRLPTKVSTPLAHKYRPEIDISPFLDSDHTRWYQQLVGILRWAVELGRIDIHLSVALLAQYLSQPRRGHLHQVFHVFAYLKAHSRSRIVLDPIMPKIDESSFEIADWTEFYANAKEPIPPNAPEPRGKAVVISCFVDADHAGNLVTRRSHTGILIFCNRAPILWYSKRQNTVETSTFGSEFIAAKIAVELIEALRYKLRMFGIPIDGPANVYCDNNSVVINSSRPESTLKRKHNAIAYHKVRESIAQGTIRITKEPGESNLADLLTKPLPGPRMRVLIQHILY